jgi:methionine biosynthesis protein MetW
VAHRTIPGGVDRARRLRRVLGRSRGVPEPVAPDADEPFDYPRFAAIEARLQAGERVADIGCGDGSFLAFLRDRGHRNMVGVDASAFAVDKLNSYGYEATCSTLEDLDPATLGPVDVAVLADVLEHVVDFEGVLAKVAAHADRVIVSHPNIGFWIYRLRLLTGRFPLQWGWHPGEHVRFFTVTDLLEHFDRAGYEVLSMQAPMGVPSGWLRERWPNLWAATVVVEIRRRRS